MESVVMVLLAKSYKPGGRCIAGRKVEFIGEKEVALGDWVRPVADDGTGKGALTSDMYTYEDGTEARVLDIVEVPIVKAFPLDGQPENYVVDETKKWKKIDYLTDDSIPRVTEAVASIWNDTTTESNKVTAEYDEQGLVLQSLCLIQPKNFMVTLSNEYDDHEGEYKRKIVASFDYLNVSYANISVTCPAVRRILTNQYPQQGEDPITMSLNKGDNYILCMSLSPRFGREDIHYKLVATAFDYDGYLQRNYA
ncbi:MULTISPECIES: dual OB domain-containing protein [unclassified Vibrio]|uniref:dual OB domain-containing protein n=1 Tax=unclassified Vibrio TaxID=2614977 RepID=UPI0029650704|nr:MULTISPECIES: hypothetical protein [unclassified Vibrio]MDW1637133.1 hypothetical protein [Vibrio sp. Vb2907]MDW1707911.1 hypothetical protein [Vibrio sp. Vb2917]MDW1722460.1 hypothetical protein [Vibrio sp. Vb2979]